MILTTCKLQSAGNCVGLDRIAYIACNRNITNKKVTLVHSVVTYFPEMVVCCNRLKHKQ
jgi:hypothetical protein